MHETVLYKGKQLFIHYVNHLKAVFVTKGTGWIELVDNKEDLGSGQRFALTPGVCYALDEHDKHWLGCDPQRNMHVVCCFAPPCDGDEKQSAHGVFPFIGNDGVHQYDYWERMQRAGQPITVTLGKPE